MEQPDSSGIGISVVLRPPSRLGSYDAQVVYFARLDAERDIRQASVIPSDYAKDGRVYLLNVPPGEYVAVAASSEYFSLFPAGSYHYTAYFSKELVELTRVSIENGQLAFAGSYVVDESIGLKKADSVQLHYGEIIAPGAVKSGCFQVPGSSHYRGSLHEARRDDGAKAEFLNKAREDLAKGGWDALIK